MAEIARGRSIELLATGFTIVFASLAGGAKITAFAIKHIALQLLVTNRVRTARAGSPKWACGLECAIATIER